MKINTVIGLSLGLISVLSSMPAQADEFYSNGYPSRNQTGHTTAGGLQGSVNYGTDAQCGGTDRAYYNQLYGTEAVVLDPAESKKIYDATGGAAFIRCGSCGDMVICWPTQNYEAVVAQATNDNNSQLRGRAKQDVFNSGTSNSGGTYNSPGYGTYQPGSGTSATPNRQRRLRSRIQTQRQTTQNTTRRVAKNTQQLPTPLQATGYYNGFPLTAYFNPKTPKDKTFTVNLKNTNRRGVSTPYSWATGLWESKSGKFIFTSVAINPQYRGSFGSNAIIKINVTAPVTKR